MDRISPKARSRYRIVNGQPIIEVTLKTPHQLFDERDPAPFRERDLDDDAAQYIISSYESLPAHHGSKLSLYFARMGEFEGSPQTIKQAIHSHFAYESEIKNRELHTTFKQGFISLLIGFDLLVIGHLRFASMASRERRFLEFIRARRPHGDGLGFDVATRSIFFFYEWWPIRSKERTLIALSTIDIDILPAEEIFARPQVPASTRLSNAFDRRHLDHAGVIS